MTQTSRSMSLAMISAAVVAAQLAAGKATRDALFFTSLTDHGAPGGGHRDGALFDRPRPPARTGGPADSPARLIPSLTVSGLLFIAEWFLRPRSVGRRNRALSPHFGHRRPAGLRLLADHQTEPFNPRTAKKGFGRITAAGTVGALGGALIAERLAAVQGGPVMVLVLAGFQFAAAWLVRRVALSGLPATPVDPSCGRDRRRPHRRARQPRPDAWRPSADCGNARVAEPGGARPAWYHQCGHR